MTTNFEKVKEFGKRFNGKGPTLGFRITLIKEEYNEVLEAFEFEGREELAKELADLLYVVYGTADYLDIDIDKVFAEVHRSNMSKLGIDGKPIYREDGKVMKGPNYSPANLEGLV